MQPSRYHKIGLLHHVGGGNLGDEATFDTVIRSINQRWHHGTIVGLSMNPADTQKRHGIPSYPIRYKTSGFGSRSLRSERPLRDKIKCVMKKYRLVWIISTMAIKIPISLLQEIVFLWKSLRIVTSLDVLIISGGGQFTEKDGPWGFPYTIFKWLLLARMANVKRVCLNVGAGPLTKPLSKFLVRRALFLSNYVSFRDENSRTLAHRIGFKGRSQVFPDSAYCLNIPPLTVANSSQRIGNAIVGIAPIDYCVPPFPPKLGQPVYDNFILNLAQFGSLLFRNNYCLELFGSDIKYDPQVIEDLRMVLNKERDIADSASIIIRRSKSVNELLAQMASMDYVVTCRFHGIVFAHLLNKPVLAISPHPKVATLMGEIGLERYCVDIQTFDANLLIETFSALVSNRDEIKAAMAERAECYKKQLNVQFDGLFQFDSLFSPEAA